MADILKIKSSNGIKLENAKKIVALSEKIGKHKDLIEDAKDKSRSVTQVLVAVFESDTRGYLELNSNIKIIVKNYYEKKLELLQAELDTL